jgi:MraZ protein
MIFNPLEGNGLRKEPKSGFFLLTVGGAKWDKVHQKEGEMERRVTTEMEELLNAGAFVGQYVHSMDGKKRVTIPSDWREAAENPVLFVLPGVNEKCLYVYTAREMAERLQKVRAASVANVQAQKFLRDFFSRADRVSLDAGGRIRVKDSLLEYAGIINQMVLVGVGSRFELWSPESWNEQNSQMDQSQFAEAAQYIGF